MYKALDVAKYVINYCLAQGRPVNNLRLQVILYYLWIDYYKKTHKALFWDDIFAWKFTPVVPDVYYEFCIYGGLPIEPICLIEDVSKWTRTGVSDDKNIKTINDVIDKYSGLSLAELTLESNREGGAWFEIYNKKGAKEIMPFSLIERLECNV